MRDIADHDFDIDGERIDLSSSDRDYLIACKLRVDANLGRVKEQVTEAKREFASGGMVSDRDWLRRAEGAIKVLGKASQTIQARLGQLSRDRKVVNIQRTQEMLDAGRSGDPERIANALAHQHHVRWEHAFVDAARVALDKETFLNLCRCAHRVVGSKDEVKP